MKFKLLVFSLGIATYSLASVQIASAAPSHYVVTQFTVHGVVPERRVIIVDASQRVRQIFSNTNNEVAPIVLLDGISGRTLPLTESVNATYQSVMSQLKTNHIVSISSNANAKTSDLPNFIQPATTTSFTVTPTKVGADSLANPYQVTVPNTSSL